MKLVCGPVIGLVSARSANILLEVDTEAPNLRCGLKQEFTEEISTYMSVGLHAYRPRVVSFEGLWPDTKYDIFVPEISDDPVGRLHTFPEDLNKIRIGVVSCDNNTFKSNYDMWKRMWEVMQEEEFHVLLHIGDNVYLDDNFAASRSVAEIVRGDDVYDPEKVDPSIPYVKARALLRKTPRDQWIAKSTEILDIYRQKYRDTWGRRYKKEVLSHVSNLMILDDHEIREDFGRLPEDSDRDSAEYYLGRLAYRVFYEYQRALWDPRCVEPDRDEYTNEFVSVNFGHLGIMMLDSRTTWSLNKDKRPEDDDSYFSQSQMKSIASNLRSRDNIRLWLVVTPLPLIFMKKKIAELSKYLVHPKDDLDSYINMKHESDLVALLEEIRDWKLSRGGNSDLLLLSGDVNLAGFTDIYHQAPGQKDKELVCRQITSSPINNQNVGLLSFAAVNALLHFTEKHGDFSYLHYDWQNNCNFVLLDISSLTGSLQYSVKLVNPAQIIDKESKNIKWDTKDTPLTKPSSKPSTKASPKQPAPPQEEAPVEDTATPEDEPAPAQTEAVESPKKCLIL